jgi:hypothetical protein
MVLLHARNIIYDSENCTSEWKGGGLISLKSRGPSDDLTSIYAVTLHMRLIREAVLMARFSVWFMRSKWLPEVTKMKTPMTIAELNNSRNVKGSEVCQFCSIAVAV